MKSTSFPLLQVSVIGALVGRELSQIYPCKVYVSEFKCVINSEIIRKISIFFSKNLIYNKLQHFYMKYISFPLLQISVMVVLIRDK